MSPIEPDFSPLQEGGIVTRPTRAVVGEGRSAEAVMPLDTFLTDLESAIESATRDNGAGGESDLLREIKGLRRDLNRRPIETQVNINDQPLVRAVDQRRRADDARLVHK